MLASVLRSPRAVVVSIALVRAFVQLRELLATHRELAATLLHYLSLDFRDDASVVLRDLASFVRIAAFLADECLGGIESCFEKVGGFGPCVGTEAQAFEQLAGIVGAEDEGDVFGGGWHPRSLPIVGPPATDDESQYGRNWLNGQ